MAPPRFLSAADQAAAWRTLVSAAHGAACAPKVQARAVAYRRAAEAVLRLRWPSEQTAPFHKLVGFGRAWCALDHAGRASNRHAVLAHVETCARILRMALDLAEHALEDAPEDTPARPFRADIDG